MSATDFDAAAVTKVRNAAQYLLDLNANMSRLDTERKDDIVSAAATLDEYIGGGGLEKGTKRDYVGVYGETALRIRDQVSKKLEEYHNERRRNLLPHEMQGQLTKYLEKQEYFNKAKLDTPEYFWDSRAEESMAIDALVLVYRDVVEMLTQMQLSPEDVAQRMLRDMLRTDGISTNQIRNIWQREVKAAKQSALNLIVRYAGIQNVTLPSYF